MTLYSLLRRHLEHGSEVPLVVTPERTYTSAAIDRESARIAGWLRARGLQPGDRVIVDLKNGADAVSALFGASRAGAIVVGATPQWTVPQLQHVIADSGARFLVTNDVRVKQLGASAPAHCHVAGEPIAETWDGEIENDPAILVYTSGSTGPPKGVVHPQRNLVDFARIVAGYLENTADDRLMWLLGWSFGYGLSQLLTACWTGGQLIVPASMLAVDVVKAHDAHRATAIAQVPYGWDQLITFLEKTGRRLEGLRYVTNAGDGPSLALLDRMPAAFPGARIVLMYGQTECLRTTFLPARMFDAKRGAMGFPIPEVDVFVVNDGKLCDVDEPGELLHRGALLSSGYWQSAEATAQKFRPEPCLGIGDEPVLHTGDIVRRDADGCLWYVGRSERMIKSSGFRFSPAEIEAILLASPGVSEAIVFGVADATLGQAVEGAIVTNDGSSNANALLFEVKKRLPRYMVPRRLHFLDAIPRNARGKIHFEALRALAAG